MAACRATTLQAHYLAAVHSSQLASLSAKLPVPTVSARFPSFEPIYHLHQYRPVVLGGWRREALYHPHYHRTNDTTLVGRTRTSLRVIDGARTAPLSTFATTHLSAHTQ